MEYIKWAYQISLWNKELKNSNTNKIKREICEKIIKQTEMEIEIILKNFTNNTFQLNKNYNECQLNDSLS